MVKTLSIIIPVYNTENYLAECLDSIIQQRIENYELIIINDGSNDGSEKIIFEYINKYSEIEIKYFYQSNSGQGAARNLGIKKSSGEYLYFMDSDDVLQKDSFKDILDILQKKKLDAIYFDGQVFLDKNYNNTSILENYTYTRKKKHGFFLEGEELFISFAEKKEIIVSPCLFIIKSEVVKKNNLFFPEKIKYEDNVFYLKHFFFIGKCEHIKEKAFLRRFRENSTMTSQNNMKKFNDYVSVLELLDVFYQTNKFKTKTGKKHFYKIMRSKFMTCVFSFDKLTPIEKNTNKTKSQYNILASISHKHNRFGYRGFIALKSINMYKFLSSIYRKVRLNIFK